MSRRLLAVVLAVGSFSVAGQAEADPLAVPTRPPMPTPIDALGPDIVDAFTGYNLFFYGGAITGTAVMAFGGIDQSIRVHVQENVSAPAYADASLYAGIVVPAVVSPTIYIVGLLTHDRVVTGAGSATLQALAVTLLTMSVLKVGVGRVYPLNGEAPTAPDRLDHPDYAHTFHPFQSLWPLPAWPSGHTIATMSVAGALTGFFPEQVWIPAVGYPLAVTIGYGMVVGDRHWASDVIAGALIGHAIGYSIGKSYRLRVRGARPKAQGLELVPLVAPGLAGVLLGSTW